MITKEERCAAASAYHDTGINCGQSVLAVFRDMTGLTEEQCFGLGTGLGGGMRCGDICGALSGAILVLGMLHPHNRKNDPELKAHAARLTKEFIRRFQEQFGHLDCRDLISCKDLVGTPMVEKLGVTKHCSVLIVSAVELLYDYLEELEGK